MASYLTPEGLRQLAEEGERSNLPTRFSFIHLRELADRLESLEGAALSVRIGLEALGSNMVQADKIFANAYEAIRSVEVAR